MKMKKNKQKKSVTLMVISFLCFFVLSPIIVMLDKTKSMESCSFDNEDLVTSNNTIQINEFDDFKSAYFACLTNNFGVNYKGSCGYVALGMLLSYYDTFLNDSIIDEQYDINSISPLTNFISLHNSPGILKDTIERPEIDNFDPTLNLTPQEYYEIIRNSSTYSFHAKLITIGYSHSYYDFSNNDLCFGTSLNSRKVILNDYLENECNMTENEDYVLLSIKRDNSTTSQDIRNFVIDKINEGYPVLIGAQKLDGGGHALIGYEYDEANDLIYCHLGLRGFGSYLPIEYTPLVTFESAMVINFNIPHTHSNNYGLIDNTGTTKFYCYNAHDILTYNSIDNTEHTYGVSFENYNRNNHKSFCSCNEYILESHDFTNQPIYQRNHYEYINCRLCGYAYRIGAGI